MKEIRDQLWDFVYGLLDEAEAVEMRQRICSDRAVAREYARVKLQSELMAQAARASEQEKDLASLPREALAMPAHVARRMSAARLIAIAGSLALSIGMLVYAGSEYWSAESPLRDTALAQRLEEFEKVQPRMVVVGPAALQAGADNTYEVQLGQLDGTSPLELPVQAEARDENGELVWSERARTSGEGRYFFHVPVDEDLDGSLKLSITAGETLSEGGEGSGAKLETYVPVDSARRSELATTNSVTSLDGKRFAVTRAFVLQNQETKAVDELLAKEINETTDGPVRDAPNQGGVSREKDLQDAQLNKLEKVRNKVRLEVRAGVEPPAARYYLEAPPLVSLKSESSVDRPADKKSKWTRHADPRSSTSSGGTSGVMPLPEGKPAAKPAASDDYAEAPARPEPREKGDAFTPQPKPAGSPSEESGVVAAPLPAAPAENSPLNSQLSGEGKKVDAKGLGGIAQNGSSTELSFDKKLVEQIKVGDKVLGSRLVRGLPSTEGLEDRFEELRLEGRIDLASPAKVDVTLYDASQAPPRKVAESSVEFAPPAEPLIVKVEFDHDWYQAGDTVVADVQVWESNGEPLSTVLNVQVDAIDPAVADQDWTPSPPEVSYVAVDDSHSAPLVFDNASQQQAELRRSLDGWIATRQQAQARVAAVLFSGSGIGFGLLVLAVALRWRPGPVLWVPIVLLLVVSLGLGILVARAPSTPVVPMPTTTPTLLTHGVQSEPPLRRNTELAAAVEFREHEEDVLKLAEIERLSRQTTLDDLVPPEASDESAELSKKSEQSEQRLLGMNEWAVVASGSTATNPEDGRQEFFAWGDGASRFRDADELDRLFGANSHFDMPALQPASSQSVGRPTGEPEPTSSPTDESRSSDAAQPAGSGTIYWHPVISTDAEGKAHVEFQVPPGAWAYRVTVSAQNGRQAGAASRLLPTVVRRP